MRTKGSRMNGNSCMAQIRTTIYQYESSAEREGQLERAPDCRKWTSAMPASTLGFGPGQEIKIVEFKLFHLYTHTQHYR